ncbi:phosphatidylcholine transfer protein-like isoform X2 [Tubulanus polymorphus]|uniref:phosphatidylcholine transfer protein-like isoform X2 n=1 Tax=Tubulanus polymorphus TaxID=672921 RepID=UPI003DA2579A
MELSVLGFSELDFESACFALCHEPPAPGDGYEFLSVPRSLGVTVFRSLDRDSGIFQYKFYGVLPDVSPDVCAQVYVDLEYRKAWDRTVKELEYIPTRIGAVYLEMKFPWPMSNRDYVYDRELRQLVYNGRTVWVMLAKSLTLPEVPEKRDVVRVTDFVQTIAVTSDVYMKIFNNPGGSIPVWLINSLTKSGIAQHVYRMQAICRGYPRYLESRMRRSEPGY